MPPDALTTFIWAADVTDAEEAALAIWVLQVVLRAQGLARWYAALETYTCTTGVVLVGVN